MVVLPPVDPIACPHKRRQWGQKHHCWTVGPQLGVVVVDRWEWSQLLGKERLQDQTLVEALGLQQAQLA